MTPPSFIRALPFPIAGRRDRFLFADAFITDAHDEGPRLVLVSTWYPDVVFDFAAVEVSLDGVRLERFEEVGHNGYEPTRALIYPLHDLPRRATHALAVRYEGQTLTARLAPERPVRPPEFSLATMFKGDYRNIETTVRYYRRQGVERFYLFYNGDLAHLPALYRAPDIVYGEWNFRYWLHAYEPPFNALLVDPMAAQNHHHAQLMFLTMLRFRFLRSCSYLALVDLDELLAAPVGTVRAHVEAIGAPSLSAPCHWAEVRTPRALPSPAVIRGVRAQTERLVRKAARRLGFELPEPVIEGADLAHLHANPAPDWARAKTIYRGDFDGLFGIHRPQPSAPQAAISDAPAPVDDSGLVLYHLVNTTHARFDLITQDAKALSLL